MASSSSVVLLLLLAAFVASASASTFTVTNNCGFTVWPAAIPVGGGVQLNPGQISSFGAGVGTSGRVWGRTGCSFNGGSGSCQTGDCAGALSCSLSGQPATLAEYTIGGGANHDYFDISVIDGDSLVSQSSTCPQAYLYPSDNTKTHACNTNSNYQITFCP